MNYEIVRICEDNYRQFDDMVFWRTNGYERENSETSVSESIKEELKNPNLFVYALSVDNRFVAWISLVYIPKVGRWNGKGHIYVDELWVQPDFRGQGFAKALMSKADELCKKMDATGERLYVNVDNPTAYGLYKSCGFSEDGKAIFMEK